MAYKFTRMTKNLSFIIFFKFFHNIDLSIYYNNDIILVIIY